MMPGRFDGLRIQRYGPENGGPAVYFNMDAEEGAALAERLKDLNWTLAVISGADWGRDLSPWPAESIRRGQPGFAGEAEEYLDWLQAALRSEEASGFRPSARFIAGYSLAGLFAAWSAVRSDCFDGFASVSGSMWYPGFAEFMEAQTSVPPYAYFSIGDRESLGRNPFFRQLEPATRRIQAHFAALGARTCLEFNPGGHFQDPLGRVERAVRWLWREKTSG